MRCWTVGVVLVVAGLLAGAAEAAGPSFWDTRDFADVRLEGAGLDPLGRLVPGLQARTVLQDSSLVFWRAAAGQGGEVFLGSGHGGQIWRLSPKGEAKLLAATDGTEVFSLLPQDDRLLAGCGPGGEILAVTKDGKVAQVAVVPGGYVWALERGPDGNVYVGAGSPAVVYRLGKSLEEIAKLPASNVLDLAFDDQGRMLASTQGPGRVFAVDPRGKDAPRLLLQIDQDEARQLLRGPDGWCVLGLASDEPPAGAPEDNGFDAMPLPTDGEMVVTGDGTAGPVRSALYDLGTATRIWASDEELMIAAYSERWGWLGGGKRQEDDRTRILSLTPPSSTKPLAAFAGGDVLDLFVRGDIVVAAQAHPGCVSILEPAGDGAAAEGPPLDGKSSVRWGRLRWSGAGDVRFAARTGASPTPDDTWSAWRDQPRGENVVLDAAESRYIQWRATLAGREARVDAVTVSGFTRNLPPVITIFEQQPRGEILLGGLMGGGDNVTQNFESGLKIEYNLGSQRERRLDRERADTLNPLRTFSWHATDPNGDRLQFRLHYRRAGEEVWRPIAGPTPDPVQTWDTTALADGIYDVRLQASDRAANTEALAQQDERILPGIVVDNTAPTLDKLRLEAVPDGLRVRFGARDATSPLAGAEVVRPDGRHDRLDPRDGVCDSQDEDFDALLTPTEDGFGARPWLVRVLVWDLAGNVRAAEASLP
jgi:hypothetical protein